MTTTLISAIDTFTDFGNQYPHRHEPEQSVRDTKKRVHPSGNSNSDLTFHSFLFNDTAIATTAYPHHQSTTTPIHLSLARQQANAYNTDFLGLVSIWHRHEAVKSDDTTINFYDTIQQASNSPTLNKTSPSLHHKLNLRIIDEGHRHEPTSTQFCQSIPNIHIL